MSVINQFVDFVKSEKEVTVNLFNAELNRHRIHGSTIVNFGVSNLKPAELLEKYQDMIIESGITVFAMNSKLLNTKHI